jgi:hypothetical protein
MAMTRQLKRVKRFLELVIVRVKRRGNSFRYLYLKPTTGSEVALEAHLLVVKKTKYASVAKVCVESFLHYHPRSLVVIHVDSLTFDEVSRELRRLISRGKVKTVLVDKEELTWQDLKLNLILELGNATRFFMDADLRWNGLIPPISNITLFVDEFKFRDDSFYAPLFQCGYFQKYIDYTMKNTSFFYWGDHQPEKHYGAFIHELMDEVLKITGNPDNPEEFNSRTRRISEQIALSLLVESTGEKVDFLKQSAVYKDGSFVESSYFGATGTTF